MPAEAWAFATAAATDEALGIAWIASVVPRVRDGLDLSLDEEEGVDGAAPAASDLGMGWGMAARVVQGKRLAMGRA